MARDGRGASDLGYWGWLKWLEVVGSGWKWGGGVSAHAPSTEPPPKKIIIIIIRK